MSMICKFMLLKWPGHAFMHRYKIAKLINILFYHFKHTHTQKKKLLFPLNIEKYFTKKTNT